MKRPPEMSRRQFTEALKRNGFKQTLLWVQDTTGQVPHISWGMLMHRGGKMAYRSTLARVLREREAEISKKGLVQATSARAATVCDHPRAESA